MKPRSGKTIFSFVLGDDPRFAYEAWHLARSLIKHCGDDPSAVHVHGTAEVLQLRGSLFRELGCHVHAIERFGDGTYCNKISQLQNLLSLDFDQAVLLDTDMIAIADPRPYLPEKALGAKIVDVANLPLATLNEVAQAAEVNRPLATCTTDAGDAMTYRGNCNGGFYCVPKALIETLSTSWRKAALWLLQNIGPLRRVGFEQHVDQTSFWLATHQAKLPLELLPSNINYFVHFTGEHRYYDPTRKIAILHYHRSFNVLGLLEPHAKLNAIEQAAVDCANEQIGDGFCNLVFWDLRYSSFADRGSGIGSRGENAIYKRGLLIEQGVETAESVLDVGCGDLEVIKPLNIRNYTGIDQSACALETARRARPDWNFRPANTPDIAPAEIVLCFEVLIHQKTAESYHALLHFLVDKTLRSLLVSGFAFDDPSIAQNPMVFFHEPLRDSLERTKRFTTVREIGRHSNVVMYRCDV